MDGIMVAVIQFMADIMAVATGAFMAAGGMVAVLEAAFTVVIDKNDNIFKRNQQLYLLKRIVLCAN
jgi:hypothetical protein